MDLYGCHFEFAGQFSRTYGLFIANVDTERSPLVSGKIQTASAYNKRNQRKHDLGSIYTEAPLVFDMEVVSETVISGELRRKIQKWLFNQSGFQKLYVDRADEIFGEVFNMEIGVPKRTYLNCRFINPEKIESEGGVVGFKFTVECDSHMAWQDPISKTYNFAGGPESESAIELNVDTDSDDYTYPKIKITLGTEGGDISIVNISDSDTRKTVFSKLDPGSVITLNSSYNFVSDNFYEHFVDRNFPRLLDGTNKLLISGDVVSIDIEWQNKRYL